MARLNRIRLCTTISFASKFKIYKSLVTHILLYGCEIWTLLTDSEKKECRLSKPSAWGKFFLSPAWTTRPNPGCREKSTFLWVNMNLLWQLSRDGKTLSKTILQGTVEDGRRRGRQRKCWMDNTKEWIFLPMPELFTRASCRQQNWKRISAEQSLIFPDDPMGQGTELN